MSKQNTVLILEKEHYCDSSINLLKKNNVVVYSEYDEYETKDIDAIFCLLNKKLDDEFLSPFINLKFIVSPTTGYNHIDYNYLEYKNIELIFLKGENSFLDNITATRDLTWGLIISSIRNIPLSFNNTLKEKKWNRIPFIGRDLDSLTLGIVGLGRLGKMMFKIASAFGMKINVFDRNIDEEFCRLHNCNILTLEELILHSDIISIHINYEKNNIGFFGEDEFKLMKTGSFFINSARGEVVDEKAMLKYLKQKKINAAIDVVANEQNTDCSIRDELIEYAAENDNLIITPHIGGYTVDSIEKTQVFITKKFLRKAASLHEL